MDGSGDKFTDNLMKILQLAREEAVRLGHDHIGTEHLLLSLIRQGEGIAVQVLLNLGLDLEELRRSVEETIISDEPSVTAIGMPPFTPQAKQILQIAANEAKEMRTNFIGTEHLLLALVKDKVGRAAQILSYYNIDYKTVKEEVTAILTGKVSERKEKKKSKTPFLDHFGRDLTQNAREGKLDPIIGRNKEIERVSQILCRRKKNNPVLIGEPGVGKTAVVEGLAQRIVEKKIPQLLDNKKIVILDMGSIVAGTKYRGQFEERMKAVMNELQQNPDIVIFIDELHTIVGAGSAEGTLDASNMFKPALSRGEVHCIGATTLDEYRKYIEKDGALERRFQPIMIDPPSCEDTIEILKGLRHPYEEHHKVEITDEAIEAAVKLADRYISDRYLPDKAIDVIDETGARAHLSQITTTPEIKELEQRIDEIAKEKNRAANNQDFEKAATLRDKERQLTEKLEFEKRKWNEKMKRTVVEISEDDISAVVSLMTGIPLSRLAKTESEKLLGIEEELKKYVIGQDDAIKAIAKAIRRTRVGLKDPRRPIGSFMFLGPTGVGKTWLAKVLAKYLFEDEEALIRIDMSEYMEKFSVSRLVGAPPGYVGYEEGGQLTEKVRRKPYSVVLLDEIEKAHPDVFNILLQVLDDGRLTDSLGRKVDFKNTILIMTSNLGTREIGKNTSFGFQKQNDKFEHTKMEEKVTAELKKTFNPEFLNRLDEVVVFNTLGKKEISKIIDLLLEDVTLRMTDKQIALDLTQSAKNLIAEKGYDPVYGARPLKRIIQKLVEDPLAEEMLSGKFDSGSKIRIVKKGGSLVFTPVSSPEKDVSTVSV